MGCMGCLQYPNRWGTLEGIEEAWSSELALDISFLTGGEVIMEDDDTVASERDLPAWEHLHDLPVRIRIRHYLAPFPCVLVEYVNHLIHSSRKFCTIQ